MLRLRDYAQLVRLPNLFTAWADICLGGLVSGAMGQNWLPFLSLLLVSSCLYCGGMVFNDFFDVEQDRRERPSRPLPSGRISLKAAKRFGVGLLALGVVFAALAGFRPAFASSSGVTDFVFSPLIVAILLVPAIFLYDSWLKRTWAGPIAMGICRFLNVLLGFCVVAPMNLSVGFHMAVIVWFYIMGVTLFARTEARTSNRGLLLLASLMVLAALAVALPLPLHSPGGSSILFPYLLVGLGVLLGIPGIQAINQPVPQGVQKAVKVALMGYVALDATLATSQIGAVGLLIVLLLLPALVLGRSIYST